MLNVDGRAEIRRLHHAEGLGIGLSLAGSGWPAALRAFSLGSDSTSAIWQMF
ncbi:MAG: hypothetical protein ACRDTH_25720 [Pseudonocardiaceae bacterium]